ncbi:MAG: LamG-like jellyroll fold domain-containing protein [Methylococcaceae bacterium]
MLRNKTITGHIPAGMLLLWVTTAIEAGEINLAWDASPSSNLGGYQVDYGTEPGRYTNGVDAGNTTHFRFDTLQDGVPYYFAAKAYNLDKTLESKYSNEITAQTSIVSPPVVGFTVSNTTGNAPLSISLTPAISGDIQSWSWDFGDGSFSSGTGPSVSTALKSYTLAGLYTLRLNVVYSGGTLSSTQSLTVRPVARFSLSGTQGTAPYSINLVDNSDGYPDTWQWDFGDGSGSTLQNPLHIYNLPGQYTVRLNVSGRGVSGTETATQTLVVVSPASGNGSNQTGNNTGLVAAYGFEEATGSSLTADASGMGNHGVLSGVNYTSGRMGSGVQFNGYNQLLTVKNAASLNIKPALTMEAWVYPKSNQKQQPLLLNENGIYPVYSLYSSGYRYLPLTRVETRNSNLLSGTAALPIYQWSHLASTYDGFNLRLYLNGREQSNKSLSGVLATSDGSLRIGANPNGGEWFSGLIDEVRIYNRALSASDIQKDMSTSVISTNPPRTLLGDNSTGSTISLLPSGIGQAVAIQARSDGLLNQLSVRLDEGSASRPLILGIYSDNQGHPDNQWASVRMENPKPGIWNSQPIKAIKLSANTVYWLAVLNPYASSDSSIKLSGGILSGPIETSRSTTLTDLPKTWSNGLPFIQSIWAESGLGY